jgi:hypothetical protein
MRIEVDVPGYDPNQGIRRAWKDGFMIATRIEEDGSMLISANRAGLESLALHLLALAQPQVPVGYHFHYDDLSSLESGSCEMVIEKIPEVVDGLGQ